MFRRFALAVLFLFALVLPAHAAVTFPHTFSSLTGTVPLSYLDDNFQALINGTIQLVNPLRSCTLGAGANQCPAPGIAGRLVNVTDGTTPGVYLDSGTAWVALAAVPAGALTGTTLAPTVVNSSLTSVGTLSAGSIPGSLVTGTVPAATVASSTSGNAATATALQTARTINGVSFNGTANITIPTGGTTGHFTKPTIAGTITIDSVDYDIFELNFTGGGTFAISNPTDTTTGHRITFIVTCPESTAITMNWGTAYNFGTHTFVINDNTTGTPLISG